MVRDVACPACRIPLSREAFGRRFTPCPACSSLVRVEAFPALWRERQAGSFGQRIVEDGEAACFYHAGKKAEAVCDGCGRFLCGLCDIEVSGQHLCASCIEKGNTSAGAAPDERVLHGQIALGLCLLAVFVWFLAPLLALASLFVAIRHWRDPDGMGEGRRWRKVLAIILSLGMLIGTGVFIYFIAIS
jgi:hypothetical protein